MFFGPHYKTFRLAYALSHRSQLVPSSSGCWRSPLRGSHNERKFDIFHLHVMESVWTNHDVIGQLQGKRLVKHLWIFWAYRMQLFGQSQKNLQDISHSHVDIDNLKLKGHVDEDVFAGKCYSVFWKYLDLEYVSFKSCQVMNLLLLCSCGSPYIQTAPKPERLLPLIRKILLHLCGRTILRHSRFSFPGLNLEYCGSYVPGLWNRIYHDTSLKMGPRFDGNCKRGLPAHLKWMIYSIYASSSSPTWSAS